MGPASRRTRGPKPGLDVDAIVTAAIEVADAEGLGALSMRKVAERLGKSAMALYTYVPGKAELARPDARPRARRAADDYPLERRLARRGRGVRRDGWDFYQRHPWVLQVSAARAVLGPHELDAYEASCGCSTGSGSPASR